MIFIEGITQWNQGLREEALKMEVREKWLDVLEKEARGSTTANYNYLQLLKSLEHSAQDEKTKSRLAARYTRIETPKHLLDANSY